MEGSVIGKAKTARAGPGRVRLGRISYLNVEPVYHGLVNGGRPAWLQITSAPPATLNAWLEAGRLDISPVSSVAYAAFQDRWLALPGLSISCRGPVMSVLLASRRPLEALGGRRVLLSRESATAAALLRLLCARRGIHPRFETGAVRVPGDLPAAVDGVLVIGDAALRGRWDRRFPHVLDLGEAWWALTGRPLVFALWAVRRDFARRHPRRVAAAADLLRRSCRRGCANLAGIHRRAACRLALDPRTCARYYRRLDYRLEAEHVVGLEAFFSRLHRHAILPEPVRLRFFDQTAGGMDEALFPAQPAPLGDAFV